MSGGPISVAEPSAETWSPAELIEAGWSEADLAWERATIAVAWHTAEGDPGAAADAAAHALRLARGSFVRDDPRLGTSLANQGACLCAAGKAVAAAAVLSEARGVWAGCGPWIDRMTAPRVARSSMFHMRMEQLHRDTYEARWREKWEELSAEARGRLSADAIGGTPNAARAHEALTHWRRERPAMLNDTRKLMAAAIFLIRS